MTTERQRGRLLSAEQVAARLEISARWVRMIPPAELPYMAMRDNGHRRYDPADVERYVALRTRRS